MGLIAQVMLVHRKFFTHRFLNERLIVVQMWKKKSAFIAYTEKRIKDI